MKNTYTCHERDIHMTRRGHTHGGDMHTERTCTLRGHTHRATFISKRNAHGGDMEGHTSGRDMHTEGTYKRRDIHTEGHIHERDIHMT